jgi:t-SNARE complex subunit (syntaxin)
MVKDRLGTLKALQADYSSSSSTSFESTDNISIEWKEAAIENFLTSVGDIQKDINEIQEKINELKKKQGELSSNIITDTEINNDIQSLMKEIESKSKFIQKKIKQFDNEILKPETNENHAEFRIRQTQYSALSHNFQKVMSDYNNSLILHKDKCKKRIKRQLEIAGRITTEEELDELVSEQNLSIFSQDIIQELKVAKRELADIEDRHTELMKLEHSIKELHSMFMDMSFLVEQQGEIIDNIEFNVTNTVDYVEQGAQQTKQARKLQIKSRKKMIFLGICLLISIIVLIIVLIFVVP